MEDADVQIVWRADLEDADVNEWAAILAAAPPMTTEALPLPYGAARRWLARASGTAAVADVEGAATEEEVEQSRRAALIWKGEDHEPVDLARLRPGTR